MSVGIYRDMKRNFPLSLLYDGYRVLFPAGKAAGTWC
jgi:hypothetical protein